LLRSPGLSACYIFSFLGPRLPPGNCSCQSPPVRAVGARHPCGYAYDRLQAVHREKSPEVAKYH